MISSCQDFNLQDWKPARCQHRNYFKKQHLASGRQNLTTLSRCASLYPRNLDPWNLEKYVAMQVLRSWNLEMLKCLVKLHLNLDKKTTFQDIKISRGQHFNISMFQDFNIWACYENTFWKTRWLLWTHGCASALPPSRKPLIH